MSPLIPLEARDEIVRLEDRQSEDVVLDDDESPEDHAEMSFMGIDGRTRLTTSFGDVPAQLLRVNDTLRTSDRRYAKIRKIDALKLDREFLAFHPDAQPVRICAGALAPGVPQKDLYLAPDQPVLAGTNAFSMKETTARALLSRPQVLRAPCEQVTYYRLTLDGEATVFSEKAQLRIPLNSGDV